MWRQDLVILSQKGPATTPANYEPELLDQGKGMCTLSPLPPSCLATRNLSRGEGGVHTTTPMISQSEMHLISRKTRAKIEDTDKLGRIVAELLADVVLPFCW